MCACWRRGYIRNLVHRRCLCGRVCTCSHVHQKKSHHWPSINRKFVCLYLLVLSLFLPFQGERVGSTIVLHQMNRTAGSQISACATPSTPCVLCRYSERYSGVAWQHERYCTHVCRRCLIQLVHVHLPVALSAEQFSFSCYWLQAVGWNPNQVSSAALPRRCHYNRSWLYHTAALVSRFSLASSFLFFTCCYSSPHLNVLENSYPLPFIPPLFIFNLLFFILLSSILFPYLAVTHDVLLRYILSFFCVCVFFSFKFFTLYLRRRSSQRSDTH